MKPPHSKLSRIEKRVIYPETVIQMMFKQVIVIRKDLKMSKGKLAAQACHASIGSYRKAMKSNPSKTKEWLHQGGKKVILWAKDKEELKTIKKDASSKIPAKEIIDSGYTELEPGTKTAIGLGPWEEEELDKYTGKLKAVK